MAAVAVLFLIVPLTGVATLTLGAAVCRRRWRHLERRRPAPLGEREAAPPVDLGDLAE